jgi:hypothetical protein
MHDHKYENMKIDMLNNPNDAMRSIMYVLDDFAGFGSFLVLFAYIFKNGLENQKFAFLYRVYFQNPEIERYRPLSKFFQSEVI